ncbi:MAG: DUF4340 domain-containing protein [Verrucomicrobiaceae bacterium]|nr:DUF4340 domain-containing protein [Verrucomicrobiaceae bacterium]
MKKTLTLIIILAALGGVAYWKKGSNERRSNSVRLVGAQDREYLLPDLRSKLNDARKVRITEADKKVTLSVVGEKWTVEERDGFPASFDKLKEFLMNLADLKIGKKQMLGKSAWGDVKLEAPAGKAEDKKGGLQVELLDEKGGVIASMILGSNRESTTVGQQQQMFGGGGNERIARVTSSDDGDTVWWVNNQFYEASSKSEDWIDKGFVDVQKIKSAEITSPKAEESWKASRKDENADFAFDGAPAGEELDDSKAALKSLLSSASFNDVLTKDKNKPDLMKDAWKAKLTTFDGFTYNVLTKKVGEGSDEKHYVSLAVSADIPAARTPGKDEKEEDKKKKDEEFATKKKELEEKLAKQKKLEGWVYEVSSYTVASLLKPRKDVLKEKKAGETKPDGSTEVKGTVKPITPPALQLPAPAKAPTPPPTPPAPAPEPKKPITVTTPPVAVPAAPVPPMPKTEIKPTPPADANPATGKPDPKPAPTSAPAAPEPKK